MSPSWILAAVAILVGAVAGLATFLHSRRLGRRQPFFWATVLIVMQAIYVAFALIARTPEGALREILVLIFFVLVAAAGWWSAGWLLVVGLLAHGAWDLRHLLVGADYVPSIYAQACVGYDWLLSVLLISRVGSWLPARLNPTAEEATT